MKINDIVTERGSVYGHPLDHHSRTVALIDIVLDGRIDTPEKWQIAMICDKLARLSHSIDHQDSWDDIAGYVECRNMTVAERERRNDILEWAMLYAE